MISRTALCILVACSLSVLGRPDFLIDHESQRTGENSTIKFIDQLGKLTLNIGGEQGRSEVIADLTNYLEANTSEDCTESGAEICKRWDTENIQLTIGFEKGGWRQVTWVTHGTSSYSRNHTNCLPLGSHSWFGGPEQYVQLWPVQKLKFSNHPLVTHNVSNLAVADPFWFNSRGIAVIVDRGVPLFIDQNSTTSKNSLCLTAKIAPPYRARRELVLSYKIGYHKNAKEAFLKSVNDYLGKPSGIPDERMIRHPTWSTWALYKADINETMVRDFAAQIKKHGFSNSQLEIDDDWEECYGSVTWNTKKFPDIQKLVRDLKRDNFRVTLWTHPFVNKNCPLYDQLKNKQFLVRNATGTETSWWNGWNKQAGIIDFTNWEATKDFVERQKKNLEYSGIDGLKFDAGETAWLPEMPLLHIPSSSYEDYPSHHVNEYLRAAAKFGNLTEVRTAYRTQDLPIFLRMIDKDTKWGYDNGLKTVVTTLLQMNMAGYPLVLPDMIGGNVYGNDSLSKELFIRWLQVNTFMPALQYSRVPWEFDDQTVTIALHYAELHANYTDKIVELMKNSTKYGTPVNPPIWWNDPTDKEALEVDSEYMLGNDILVAPILDEGMTARDIYLPAGDWRDMGSSSPGKIYKGKQWLTHYDAPLETLPYFVRVNSAASLSATLLVVFVAVFTATFGRPL